AHLRGGPRHGNRLEKSETIQPVLLRREPLIALDELQHVVSDCQALLGGAMPQLLVHRGRDILDLDNAHGRTLACSRHAAWRAFAVEQGFSAPPIGKYRITLVNSNEMPGVNRTASRLPHPRVGAGQPGVLHSSLWWPEDV